MVWCGVGGEREGQRPQTSQHRCITQTRAGMQARWQRGMPPEPSPEYAAMAPPRPAVLLVKVQSVKRALPRLKISTAAGEVRGGGTQGRPERREGVGGRHGRSARRARSEARRPHHPPQPGASGGLSAPRACLHLLPVPCGFFTKTGALTCAAKDAHGRLVLPAVLELDVPHIGHGIITLNLHNLQLACIHSKAEKMARPLRWAGLRKGMCRAAEWDGRCAGRRAAGTAHPPAMHLRPRTSAVYGAQLARAGPCQDDRFRKAQRLADGDVGREGDGGAGLGAVACRGSRHRRLQLCCGGDGVALHGVVHLQREERWVGGLWRRVGWGGGT